MGLSQPFICCHSCYQNIWNSYSSTTIPLTQLNMQNQVCVYIYVKFALSQWIIGIAMGKLASPLFFTLFLISTVNDFSV